MQDGPGHTQWMLFWAFCMTLSTLMSSQNRFPDCFACGQNWSPNSPDLNPCDSFLWESLRKTFFWKKPQTIMKLRPLIIQACNEITEDMCCRVNNITVHVEEVARRNGGHIEHLIHRPWTPYNGLSCCMLFSSIVFEINIFLIDQIPDYFVCHPVFKEWISSLLVGWHNMELSHPASDTDC
jgi:hypothetical protein